MSRILLTFVSPFLSTFLVWDCPRWWGVLYSGAIFPMWSFAKKAFAANKYLKAHLSTVVVGLTGVWPKQFSGLLYAGDQTRQSKQSLLKLKPESLWELLIFQIPPLLELITSIFTTWNLSTVRVFFVPKRQATEKMHNHYFIRRRSAPEMRTTATHPGYLNQPLSQRTL